MFELLTFIGYTLGIFSCGVVFGSQRFKEHK